MTYRDFETALVNDEIASLLSPTLARPHSIPAYFFGAFSPCVGLVSSPFTNAVPKGPTLPLLDGARVFGFQGLRLPTWKAIPSGLGLGLELGLGLGVCRLGTRSRHTRRFSQRF